MNAEQFFATLAMNSYNQGYATGVTNVGLTVGPATIIADSSGLLLHPITNQPLDKPTGFYAVAYRLTQAVGDLAAGVAMR